MLAIVNPFCKIAILFAIIKLSVHSEGPESHVDLFAKSAAIPYKLHKLCHHLLPFFVRRNCTAKIVQCNRVLPKIGLCFTKD